MLIRPLSRIGLVLLALCAGPAAANAVVCPGNGTLIVNLSGAGATEFVSTDNTEGTTPVSIAWTDPAGTARSVTTEVNTTYMISTKSNTPVTYSCPATGTVDIAVDTESAEDLALCATAATGTAFQELAGVTLNVVGEIDNTSVVPVTVTYTSAGGSAKSGLVPGNSTLIVNFVLEPGSMVTYSCPSIITGIFFGFKINRFPAP